MCTYETSVIEVAAQLKVGGAWGPVREASIYLDHPVAYPALHTLNLDFFDSDGGRRGALELDPTAARRLAVAILDLLDRVPPELIEVPAS